MKNRLKEIREARGLSQPQLAEMVNTTRQQISRLEKGNRRLSDIWLRPLSEALNTTIAELVGERGPNNPVAIAGYVGAGAEIFPFDDSAKGAGLDEVERPPGLEEDSIVAVKVRGTSMLPVYRDGDVLFYSRTGPDDWSRHVGDECVVQVSDGRVFLKILRRGSRKGLAILSSYNADDIVDVKLDWAAPIRWIMRAPRHVAGGKLALVRGAR